MKLVAIPKTIDKDIGKTQTTIGFDTAVTKTTDALDCLWTTAASHERVMVLEVMGRDCGHLALQTGIAGGADVILIPEIPYKIENVINKIKQNRENGIMHTLIVCSEAIKTVDGDLSMEMDHGKGRASYRGAGQALADAIVERSGFATRATALGHVQRGGDTSANDRIIASVFGAKAIELIEQGEFGVMVGWDGGKIIVNKIEDVVAEIVNVKPDDHLVKAARDLGIVFGDE